MTEFSVMLTLVLGIAGTIIGSVRLVLKYKQYEIELSWAKDEGLPREEASKLKIPRPMTLVEDVERVKISLRNIGEEIDSIHRKVGEQNTIFRNVLKELTLVRADQSEFSDRVKRVESLFEL